MDGSASEGQRHVFFLREKEIWFWYFHIASSQLLSVCIALLTTHLIALDVGDIRYSKLKERGIKAVIFDKDNTLTAPYAAEWYSSRIADCIRDCQDEFGVQNVAICSNTVGSRKDRTKHNYAGAEEIQVIMGVKVVRHELNKPLTPVSDIIDHFQSFREGEVGQTRFLQPHEIAVIGDRYVGDILWGNSQGFLTIKTEPLTFVGENFAVRLVRFKQFLRTLTLFWTPTDPYPSISCCNA